ncbi:hypothetical protein [Bifidobacterium tibiigranuli]|jgi:hypothetical protein|uniref:hypothetical protein n=1 Tax=Bifidobacterium tibiigranuli TaxID=2172043 RepID=UPI0026EA35E6|nr:hypothetical protein [Bifidobacterium tibiigranuli]MCI1713360.1 hypothetical protein [Bifidobacterium tibiigranuli]MCI2184849.1 hypothetical protein [Bifidobacterium tibiigranuli]MCI2204360.1 hypothetical protein [Bifidobacterium tibiigranuli]
MNASTSPNCAGTANNAYYWPAVPPKLTDSQFEQRERHLAKQYRHLDRLRRRHELRMHYLTLRITLGKMNAVLDYWPSTIAGIATASAAVAALLSIATSKHSK